MLADREGGGKRTLDLQANSHDEVSVWTRYFRQVFEALTFASRSRSQSRSQSRSCTLNPHPDPSPTLDQVVERGQLEAHARRVAMRAQPREAFLEIASQVCSHGPNTRTPSSLPEQP